MLGCRWRHCRFLSTEYFNGRTNFVGPHVSPAQDWLWERNARGRKGLAAGEGGRVSADLEARIEAAEERERAFGAAHAASHEHVTVVA